MQGRLGALLGPKWVARVVGAAGPAAGDHEQPLHLGPRMAAEVTQQQRAHRRNAGRPLDLRAHKRVIN